MTIDLSDYESGIPLDEDYEEALYAMDDRLTRIQAAFIHHRRSAIIAFEGWDASGKGGAIKRLTAPLDPRFYKVHSIGAPSEIEKRHNYLWRFDVRLPPDGNIAIFDRSWYGRVAVERVEGYAKTHEWQRAFDEINRWEERIMDLDRVLIKIFMHVTQEEQDERFQKRLTDPWKRWKTGPDDYRNRARRADYLEAYAEMFSRTDTARAPWTVIDGNRKKSARLAVMRAVADRLEAAVDMSPPPLDPAVAKLAKEAFGFQPG